MNEESTNCGECGHVITDEAPDIGYDQRNPCPKCGSLKRSFSAVFEATIHFTGSVDFTVITYPEALLATCKGLIDDGKYSISVVVAHMACEVSTERALSAAFASREIDELKEPVLDFTNGYNLGNVRNRKLYTALTGDNIEQQPFWSAFKESATRRNNIIHNGLIVDQPEAEETYQAASLFVAHLKID